MLNLQNLTQVLYYAAGITRIRRGPEREILFRAAPCTGALYEIELYLVCGGLPDLEAGGYHFSPPELALRRIRAGDFRGAIARATAGDPRIVGASVTIICTGTYWRNSWKSQACTYRHFGWDIRMSWISVIEMMPVPAGVPLNAGPQTDRVLE